MIQQLRSSPLEIPKDSTRTLKTFKRKKDEGKAQPLDILNEKRQRSS